MTITDAAVDALVLARANGQRARRLAPPITSVDELWSPETWQHAARRNLAEVVPVLHPTIPNTVEALGALPIGSVIRGNDADGPVAERETSDEWAIWDGSYTTPQVVDLGQRYDITEWTVLWPLGGAA